MGMSMHSLKQCLAVGALALAWWNAALAAPADEPVNLDVIGKIRQEAFYRSQVMDTLGHLAEDIGPRLTNSPNMAKANAWTRTKLSGWGLVNAHDEAFADFGRGWEFRSASVDLLAPRVQPLHALPKAWTPGTQGPVEGEAAVVSLKTKADFDKYHGKLRGKIALLDEARDYKPGTEPDSRRLD